MTGAFGWLPLVLPADGSVAAADLETEAALRGLGVEPSPGSARPDVEIGRRVTGRAPVAVVRLGSAGPREGNVGTRAAQRLFRGVGTAAGVRRVARRLRRVYPVVETIGLDLEQPIAISTSGRPPSGRPVERLPRMALVIGRRDGVRSLLDAAIADGERATGTRLVRGRVFFRETGLVVLGEDAVLRVTLGQTGRAVLEAQQEALAQLRAAKPGDEVAELVPWVLGHGRVGPATWQVEERLRGARPATMTKALQDQCIDFLLALHHQGGENPVRRLGGAGETVAAALRDGRAGEVRRLAERLDERLAGVPRGFGHGDFWAGNLLVSGASLTGVIDWDGAGPGRLPLLDLLHLRVTTHARTGRDWGPAVMRRLVPLAKAGGDAEVHRYSRGVGIDASPALLLDLIRAYWLERVAYQLRTFQGRADSRDWMTRNVHRVVPALIANSL